MKKNKKKLQLSQGLGVKIFSSRDPVVDTVFKNIENIHFVACLNVISIVVGL